MIEEDQHKLLALTYLDLGPHRGVIRAYPREVLQAWGQSPRPSEHEAACARFEADLLAAYLGHPIDLAGLPAAVSERVRRAVGAALNRYYFSI